MAGIFSQGGSAGHRYAGWLSEVVAKNFQFGGKVFNGSPSAIYVGSKMVWMLGWLEKATQQAILGAFGQRDGMAVIKATNAYLNQLAASDRDKATALAGFINEDPMMVCSLGLEVEGVTMPIRFLKGDGNAWCDTDTNFSLYSNPYLEFTFYHYAKKSEYDPLFGNWASGKGNTGFWVNNGYLHTRWGRDGGITYNNAYVGNTTIPHKVIADMSKVQYDSTVLTTSISTINYSGFNRIFNDYPYTIGAYCAMAHLKINAGSTPIRDMVPFIRNNVNGMLDIVNDVFYPNLGSGAFSIDYRFADGTEWTPSTP